MSQNLGVWLPLSEDFTGVQLPQMALAIGFMEVVQKSLDDLEQPTKLSSRHMNAIIRAADMVVAEFQQGFREAMPGEGIEAWLKSDETGLSSRELAACLIAAAYGDRGPRIYFSDETSRPYHPHDPSDFGRCVKMLDSDPKLREHLSVAANLSPTWASLIAAWDELELLYREELPSGAAPRLYARMQESIHKEK